MGGMAKQFFEGMDYTHFPVFALLVFITLFVGVVVATFVVKKKRDFDDVAALPLNDETSEVKP